ncbi:MAG TPA: thioredoxin family protein [Chitinophagaceae bacterium]|nr:thioredoxin family protein [Chitinophagaceae bacterium]
MTKGLKKTGTCLTCILVITMGQASGQQGIRFTDLSWPAVQVIARRQHRIIFADVYTDWCRPCKLMDQEVFSEQSTGDFFNAHFVNYRMNAEKGEGRQLARLYGVPSYPFYLFVDSTGKLIYSGQGFCNGDQLVATAKTALKKYLHR